jgi:hypothetical protein
LLHSCIHAFVCLHCIDHIVITHCNNKFSRHSPSGHMYSTAKPTRQAGWQQKPKRLAFQWLASLCVSFAFCLFGQTPCLLCKMALKLGTTNDDRISSILLSRSSYLQVVSLAELAELPKLTRCSNSSGTDHNSTRRVFPPATIKLDLLSVYASAPGNQARSPIGL